MLNRPAVDEYSCPFGPSIITVCASSRKPWFLLLRDNRNQAGKKGENDEDIFLNSHHELSLGAELEFRFQIGPIVLE